MKLNKFLVAAAAVAVLPLSVAHAVEEAPVVEKPEVVLDANGQPVIKDGKFETRPSATQKGEALVNDAKVEFKGGVNGPGLVNEKAPYAEKGASLVNEKPEFNLEDLKKSEKPAPAKPVKKVLPKTHAVK